ncbi:hypothetical protein B9Z19DRAFT_1125516 [Tuber borchii]|uniref:Uncharacterized protein n=1 Tax=Tuber borchii TaxID=42251 RepID=A0A2T6ZUX6_TUBBO|nr:hypothetical protein B9Z19DRAFT_1125516 [Tuber borchii]
MALMLRYTLFNNLLPNAVALTSQVYTVWSKVLDTISDSGYIDPSEESLKLGLPKDPIAMAPRIEYLLEGDRFICSANGYENLTFRFLVPQIAYTIYGKYFNGIKMQEMLDQGFLKWINIRSLPVEWGQDSLNPSQETDTSLDFSQISVDLESEFLDSDPAGPEDGCRRT